MFGDKRLEIDTKKVMGTNQMKEIFGMFGMTDNSYMIARRLVELNNEVYDKLHPKCTCAKCTGIDKESMFVDE
jgi:hypothetical protein